ncbi:hypothetical protein TBLA_0A06630 [Henningerozyma blattae CBS 6284]|uniref:Mitochondrial carrier protein n=1 Tax=Henningerozyma blattae (strain ATCC 34711 / CBS 6284 / DSM 70876 / NBRC 10599 / NRRL Y-10934 / UCD 77-7) TaxID=1071380 RepID=I2GWF3_HENB6|nr:hypothetical protein TBLA_0A06630 [Tetrapisispora blattae CBS 6284]CCH58455.1 hypothetical protein TBLA_0A06630 [Tetrapisispora blattae CBS 6284]
MSSSKTASPLSPITSSTPISATQPAHDNTRIIKDLLAGTAGGIGQVVVGQPFDTTKVRLQTSKTPTTALHVLRDLFKNEGPLALYKGMLTPLVGAGACVAVQFGTNEALKRFFRHQNADGRVNLHLWQYYLCGLGGGIANAFLACPMEHVRIRLQVQKAPINAKNVTDAITHFNGPLDCINQLWARGALMRGLPAMLIRAGHGLGVYFLTYEALVAHSGVPRKELPAWKSCLYGGCAGSMLWLAVYPLDVVKSVIQTDSLNKPRYSDNIWKVAKQLYSYGGSKAFFRGFGPTMLRAAPANGATFCAFEMATRVLG